MANHPLATIWVDGQTVISAAYMQVIDDVVMRLLEGKTTPAEVLDLLGGAPTTHTHDMLMTVLERLKLAGISEGAEVNPPQVTTTERSTGTSVALRSYAPDDIRNMVLTHAPGGEAAVSSAFGRTGDVVATTGDYTAEQITDTANAVIMTIAERSKLYGIADGAQVNPAHVSAPEKAAGTATADRTFSPVDIKDMIATFAGAITSIFGRTGVVTAQSGDYTADQITETSTAKIMTGDERSKLSGIATGAQVNRAISSQAQAEAGADNTTDMTPLRAAQAIAAQVPDATSGTKGRVQLAGGIGGTAAAPWPVGLRLSGPTDVTLGSVADGQFLTRSGSSIVGASGTGTFDISALTVEPLVDNAADSVPFLDNSAGANRRVLPRSLGAPLVLGDPYDDRLIKIAAKGQDISASLRAALAATASGQYTTIKLIGAGTGARDGSNNWLFQLPASKRIAIVGEGPHGFHLSHAFTADATAWPIFSQTAGSGGVMHLENLVLQGTWSSQSTKQEVSGARFTNLRQYREVRLYGLRGIDGVEMGFTAQECGIVDVDRCQVERCTSNPFDINGRRVSIRNSKAFYSRGNCFAIYVPSAVSDDENWLDSGRIVDCEAAWTLGILAAAPRLTISRNHLDVPFNYGIRVYADESSTGEVIAREMAITDNLITNCLANDQVNVATVVNRAITIDSYTRAAAKILIRGNRVASTFGALWNGTNYQTPSVLTRGLASADDSSGLYAVAGFGNAWQAPTTASREPAHRRIVALSISSQSAPGYGDFLIRDNTGRDVIQTESWQYGWVLHNNASGTNWAVPLAETAWASVSATRANFAGPGSDVWFQKCRLEIGIGATTKSGAIVTAQYSATGSAPWTDLCAVTLTSGTSTTLYGSYVDLPNETIQAPAWIRVIGEGGDGSTNVAVTRMVLNVVRDGDQCFDTNASQRGGGAVLSVFGRTSAVSAAAGDYTADQITETATNVVMTADERAKLSAIDPGVAPLPTQVTSGEITASTETALRSFSPADIKSMAQVNALFSSSVSQMKIGDVAYRDTAVHLGDTTLPPSARLIFQQDQLFKVQWVQATLPANSATPVDVALPLRVNPAKTLVLYAAPRSRNGGPTGTYRFNLSKYGHVRLGLLNNGRSLRFEPIDRGEANAPESVAAAQVIEYIGPAGGAYEFANLGVYDVTVSGVSMQATQNFTSALASDAVLQKTWICCDRGSGGSTARENGPIAFPSSLSAFTVIFPRPTAPFSTTTRAQVIHFSGSAWRLGKVYGGITPPSFNTGALCAAVVNGGTGDTNGNTVTLAGATGTAATFTTTSTGGVVSALVLAGAGSMSAVPSNPATFTGGGTGLTAFIHYNTGADAGDVLIRDKYPTSFNDSTRAFTNAAGVATQSIGGWERTMILPGGVMGVGGTTSSALIATDTDPLLRPGTGADPTDLSNINYVFDAAHTSSGQNIMAVVLEDTLGGSLGMRVTRFTQAAPTDAANTDIDITTASIIDKDETLLLGCVTSATAGSTPSGTSGTPPSGGTGGYQRAHCLLLPYKSPAGVQYARIQAPDLAAIANLDAQVVALPRSVLSA